MYSGSQFFHHSGNLIGTHQKIDRAARKNLIALGLAEQNFPTSKQILHFEGKNGPDGIKSKSPGHDEPWHFYDPFDDDDRHLLQLIEQHSRELTQALKKQDMVSAAFQAAWLAHTIVDGLTPAHHYPYEEEIETLTKGSNMDRTSKLKKVVMPGDTLPEKLKNNWKMWGTHGLLSRHQAFETGVTLILAPLKLAKKSKPSQQELDLIAKLGVSEYFARVARQIALLDMYDRFYEHGWNNKLVRDVRNELGPTLVRTVAAIWYDCARQAQIDGKKSGKNPPKNRKSKKAV